MKSEDEKSAPFEAPIEGGDAGGLGAAAAAENAPAAADDELSAARRAAEEAQDLYLRERAELENFKKRAHRERRERERFAVEPLARDLLTVVDDLERALEHAKASEESTSLVAGVEMVLKGAREALQRHGVERFDATGEVFDPARHQAVAQLPDPSVAANHVAEQFLCGYRLHDRLLRAAQVSVSTGPQVDEE